MRNIREVRDRKAEVSVRGCERKKERDRERGSENVRIGRQMSVGKRRRKMCVRERDNLKGEN